MEKIKGTAINIGPQHPALKEPETFQIVVESERIIDAFPILGHAHRGIEKMAESRTADQNLYLTERICGICSFAHQSNYATAVEKVAGIDIPVKAKYLRVLVAELERLHSHLLWIGVLSHEIGFDTFYMLVWKDRELVMDVLESLTGNRVNYGMNAVGGVRSDLTPDVEKQLRKLIPDLKKKMETIRQIAISDQTVQARCKNVGTISKEMAMRTSATGPTARASGITTDLRRDLPYFAYEEMDFEVHVATAGDVYTKIVLRMDELFDSLSMVEQVLEKMPRDGDIRVKVKGRLEGKAISRVEAPRGENFHFVEFRKEKEPYRVKVRAPTYANLTSAMEVLIGHHIADIPTIVASCDPCFSCTDRTLVVDRDLDKTYMMTATDLRNYGIKIYKEGTL